MSLPLFRRLPWTSCSDPTNHEFPFRINDHDIEDFEDAIFCSRIVSPRLERYKLNVNQIELMLTESSSSTKQSLLTKDAFSNITPILLTYRVFDIMNKGEINPQHHPRLAFNFDHHCVCLINLC